jgi:hypothetical protein
MAKRNSFNSESAKEAAKKGHETKAKNSEPAKAVRTAFFDICAEIGDEVIEVNGKSMTKIEMVYRACFSEAIKGNMKATQIILNTLAIKETSRPSEFSLPSVFFVQAPTSNPITSEADIVAKHNKPPAVLKFNT